jgi:fucose permease
VKKGEQKFLIAVLFLIFYTLGLGYVMTFRLLGAMGDFFKIGPAKTGLFVLLPGVGMLLSLLTGGYVSDRISKRMVLIVGLSFCAVGFLGVGLKMSLGICLVSIFISGLGFGLIQSSGNAFIFTAYPQKSVFMANLLHLFLVAGCSSAPWIAGGFIQGETWYLSYIAVAVLMVLLLVFFWLISSQVAVQKEEMNFDIVKHFTSNRVFQLFCLAIFLHLSSEIGIASWMSSFLEREKSFSISEANLALSLYWVMMVPSRVVMSWLSLRMPVNRLLSGCAFVSLIGIGMTIFAKTHFFTIGGFVLTGLCFGPIFPTLLGLGVRSVGRYEGLASGILLSIGIMGQSLYPYLMGIVSRGTNFHLSMLLGGIPIVCLICIFPILFRKQPIKVLERIGT